MTNKKTLAAIALEMKQIFRKDAPVMSATTVIRPCNASQRMPYTGNRMASPRDRANDHFLVDSVGTPC